MFGGRVSRFKQRRLDGHWDNLSPLLIQMTHSLNSKTIGKCWPQRLKMIVMPVISQTKSLVAVLISSVKCVLSLFVRTNIYFLLYTNAVYERL